MKSCPKEDWIVEAERAVARLMAMIADQEAMVAQHRAAGRTEVAVALDLLLIMEQNLVTYRQLLRRTA